MEPIRIVSLVTTLLIRLRTYLRILRITPFDETTEQGQRDERYRRAFLSSFTMIIGRAISLSSSVLTVYFIAPSLGAERFGVLNTVIAFFAIGTILDFGIPAALVNRIAYARLVDKLYLARVTSSAIIIIFAVGIFASLLCFFIALFIPWSVALNSQSLDLIAEARITTLLASPILCIQLVNAGLSNILMGLQRGFITNILMAVVNLSSVVSIILATHYLPHPLGYFWAMQGLALFVPVILIVYFGMNGYLDWPRQIHQINIELIEIWRISRPFFFMNIIIVISLNLDVLLASAFLNPESVSQLVMVQRFFQVFIGISSVMALPLWAAYADAFVKNDILFIRFTVIRSIFLSLFLIIICFPVTIYFSDQIFTLWTRGEVIPEFSLVCIVAASASIGILQTTFSYYLNGCGIMRPQLIANLIYAIISVILKFLLVQLYGIEGIVAGGFFASVISNSVSYGILFYRQTFSWLWPKSTAQDKAG